MEDIAFEVTSYSMQNGIDISAENQLIFAIKDLCTMCIQFLHVQ